jgi:hypothetical protein
LTDPSIEVLEISVRDKKENRVLGTTKIELDDLFDYVKVEKWYCLDESRGELLVGLTIGPTFSRVSSSTSSSARNQGDGSNTNRAPPANQSNVPSSAQPKGSASNQPSSIVPNAAVSKMSLDTDEDKKSGLLLGNRRVGSPRQASASDSSLIQTKKPFDSLPKK